MRGTDPLEPHKHRYNSTAKSTLALYKDGEMSYGFYLGLQERFLKLWADQ